MISPLIYLSVARQDTKNIVQLEHVNINVMDQSTATDFYVLTLGLTRDPFVCYFFFVCYYFSVVRDGPKRENRGKRNIQSSVYG